MKTLKSFKNFLNLNEGLLYQDNSSLVWIEGNQKVSTTEWDVKNWLSTNFFDLKKLCRNISNKYSTINQDKGGSPTINVKIFWKPERIQQIIDEPTLDDIKNIVIYSNKYNANPSEEIVLSSFNVNQFKLEFCK